MVLTLQAHWRRYGQYGFGRISFHQPNNLMPRLRTMLKRAYVFKLVGGDRVNVRASNYSSLESVHDRDSYFQRLKAYFAGVFPGRPSSYIWWPHKLQGCQMKLGMMLELQKVTDQEMQNSNLL